MSIHKQVRRTRTDQKRRRRIFYFLFTFAACKVVSEFEFDVTAIGENILRCMINLFPFIKNIFA